MNNRLFVGNLSFSVTDKELSDLFAQAGSVNEAKVVMDTVTGRSRGFGFVTMATDAEAGKAIALLHGADAGGRALVVSEARPRTGQ
jgi:RNA recognition motif-containing protein